MKMGRPKKDNAKRKSITIRLSEETYRKLIEYAAKQKSSISEVTLQCLEEHLLKEK